MKAQHSRRTTLKIVGAAILTTLGGCSGVSETSSENRYDSGKSNLTISFKGDTQPEQRRSLLILITKEKTNIINGDTESEVSLTTKDGVYFQKYDVKPEVTLRPRIFIEEKGEYRLIIWVEDRGTINTNVEIDSSGTLDKKHKIIINKTGMGHQ